jgi:hypothetical protein
MPKIDLVLVLDGLPEIVPVFLFNLSPLGKLDLGVSFQVGGFPPAAARVCE